MYNDPNATPAQKAECKLTGKCVMGFIIMSAVFFALIMGYEWLFHGKIMMADYEATKSVWRDETSMLALCWVNMLREAVMAMIFVCVMCWFNGGTNANAQCSTECPIGRNTKLGFKLGLLVGITMFGSYFYLPLPDLTIPIKWLVGYTVEGTLLGMIFGIIQKKKCTNAPAA